MSNDGNEGSGEDSPPSAEEVMETEEVTTEDGDEVLQGNVERAEEDTEDNGSGGESGNSADPEQVRQDNREGERTGLQRTIDAVGKLTTSVVSGKDTDTTGSAEAAQKLAEIEEANKDAQDEIISRSEDLQERAAAEKTGIELSAAREDTELLWSDDEKERLESNYEARVEGGEIEGYRFGAIVNAVNTAFLMEDVVKMRNVEDDSYTHGEKKGTSLPFIEQADIRDEDAEGWAEGFNEDLEAAVETVEEYVSIFNPDERLEAYQKAVKRCENGSRVTNDLDELDDIDAPGLEDVNDELEGELQESTLEELRGTISSVGEDLNGREDGEGYGEVDMNPEERQKAEELARQEEARSLDKAKLHADRLETAREELGSLREQVQERKQAVEEYREEVEDLANVKGIGEDFSELLSDMGIDTVMDLAARTDFTTNTEYQRRKNESGVAAPSPDTLIENAYDALTEIADGYEDTLDLEPTDVISEDGEDYSLKDQRRRMMEAVYDSGSVLERLFGAIDARIPDLDEYDPDWDGEQDTIEEERQAFYESELGISDVPDVKESLNYERMVNEIEE